MHLCGVAADRRNRDGVLEQPAGVVVVEIRARGQLAEPGPEALVGEKARDDRLQSGIADLAAQELEEAVELVGVPAEAGCERGGILSLGRLE
jgi:hypothetical protein